MKSIAQNPDQAALDVTRTPKTPRRDLVGQRFGRLLVTSFFDRKGANARWAATCECGTERIVYGHSLIGGRTKSCGCLRLEAISYNTEMLCKNDDLHAVWKNMVSRCTNKNHSHWKLYGGRGITVCTEWLMFEAFRRDMAPRPAGHQLDRINNDAGYSRENCHWVTPKENCRNRRSNVLVEFNGRMMTVSEAAELSGIPRLRIYQRLSRGNKDLFYPVKSEKRPHHPRTENTGRWASKSAAIAALKGGAA